MQLHQILQDSNEYDRPPLKPSETYTPTPTSHNLTTPTQRKRKTRFISEFSPDHFATIATNPYDCINGNHRTLAGIDRLCGQHTALTWLVVLIDHIVQYTNVKTTLNAWQQQQLATTIRTQFHYLTPHELVLFTQQLKAGRYILYNNLDPITICNALQDFIRDYRNPILQQHEREQATQRAKAEAQRTAKYAITKAEYNERKRKYETAHPGKSYAEYLLQKRKTQNSPP